MSDGGGPGRILTFYSYKGGTGRTMLLANVAWILASAGKRVLVVDWDLEAPGLHRYLHPFLLDPELTATEGLIDFVTDYAVSAMTPDHEGDDWWVSRADISRYAVSLEYEGFPEGATLDFVPAGRQGEAYASRVNSFDWQDFYGRLGGGPFLDAVKQKMREEYDYVLVDSRTGVSDTAGICTVQLPDTLVVCFTLNTQSIEGAAAVAESVAAQRGLPVFPVATRIEFAEKQKLDQARARARQRFGSLLSHLDVRARVGYWGHVEVIYQPFYAYEEVLATFADQAGQPNSLLGSIERLTGYVTGGAVERLVPPSAGERRRVLALFSGLPEEAVPAQPAAPGASFEEVVELTRRLEEKEQEVAVLAARQAANVAAPASVPPAPVPTPPPPTMPTEAIAPPVQSAAPGGRRRALLVVLALLVVGAVALGLSLGGGDDPAEHVHSPTDATAEPSPVIFGTHEFGNASNEEVTLTAEVEGPVPVVRVSTEGSADFAVVDDSCSGEELGVTPEDEEQLYQLSCTVTVEFYPGRDGEGPGPREGELVFHGEEGDLSVPITGCKETCE